MCNIFWIIAPLIFDFLETVIAHAPDHILLQRKDALSKDVPIEAVRSELLWIPLHRYRKVPSKYGEEFPEKDQ